MARIIYGVCGDGYGHSVRSKVIVEHLRKNHEVYIIGGGKAYSYLSHYFKDTTKVEFLRLQYKNNTVQSLRLLALNFKNIISLSSSFLKVKNLMKEVKPDLVISDFEALASYNASFLKIPVISIGNHHLITNCELAYPQKFYNDYLKAKLVIKIIMPKTMRDIIMTYIHPKLLNKKSVLVPPVIRREIQGLKTRKKDFVLVYQTSNTNKKLLNALQKLDENFIVYGFEKEGNLKNVAFRKFNENGFLDELANCKALITNGGFGSISEALYLGKPILSIPIKKTFEQIINAVNLEKTCCGKFVEEATVRCVREFLNDLDLYNENAAAANFRAYWNNETTFKKLELLLK